METNHASQVITQSLLKHCVIYFLSCLVSYHSHPCWFHLAPVTSLLSSEHDRLFLLSWSLHCLFLSPRKFLSSDLLMAFSCLLKYHPQDTFLSQKSPPLHPFIPLICLIFLSKHISLLETMFFVCLFHWNINSERGDLAFLFPVEFSVLNSSACDIKDAQ